MKKGRLHFLMRLTVLILILVNTTKAQDSQFMLRLEYHPTNRLKVMSGQSVKPLTDALIARQPGLAQGSHLAFSIRNLSDLSIVALTVRWKWIGLDGSGKSHDFRSDSFYLDRRPILKPKETLIAFPGLFAVETPSGFAMGGMPLPNTLRQFDGASMITATIDCVAFEDGTWMGSDESATIDGIIARKRIATDLARSVLMAISAGRTPGEGVDEYMRSVAPVRSRPESSWHRRLADLIINSIEVTEKSRQLGFGSEAAHRRPENVARKLASLPDLPHFKRDLP